MFKKAFRDTERTVGDKAVLERRETIRDREKVGLLEEKIRMLAEQARRRKSVIES
jgi:hypothetical protein